MKKLKLKFILIASGSFSLVLIIVLGIINFISFRNIYSEIYTTLRLITENHGLPDFSNNQYKKYDDIIITPEIFYETRYFLVEYNEEMVTISIDRDNIAAVSESDVADFINIVTKSERNDGMINKNNLRYAFLKTKTENGNTLIAFMDCTRRIYSLRNTIRFSIYVGIISMLLLILLLSFFSRRAVAPIIRNMESQKQFITNASHELKTPLAVISANAEVLEMMNGKSEWTDSIRNQVTHMSELVSQLIVLSKLQEHDDITLTEVNISAKAEDVAKSFKTVAEAAGKTFEAEITPDIKILADERGSRELISILVDNAVKYCDQDGKIHMSLTSRGKKAYLVVSNDYKDGEGVDYSRFFERFYRADESHNNETKGYGIGLSMAEGLVDMFHGKISVNYKNKVITFTVIL